MIPHRVFRGGETIPMVIHPLGRPSTPAVFEVQKALTTGPGNPLYKARLASCSDGSAPGLVLGQSYALCPDPDPATSAWHQALFQRAAGLRLGHESCIATAWGHVESEELRGRLQEWIEGRPWKLEIEDQLFRRPLPPSDPDYTQPTLFRSEYVAKLWLMARLARLFRELGADVLARRYHPASWLGPTRILQREGFDAYPYAGLAAIDFTHADCDSERLSAFLREQSPAFADLPPRPPSSSTRTGPTRRFFLAFRQATHPAPAHNAVPGPTPNPLRLIFSAPLRTQWLLKNAAQGEAEGMLSPSESARIREQVQDPYIQLYLKCLAVHLCLLPVTNLVVLVGGALYSLRHELPLEESLQVIALAWAFFAVFPLSPGSILRGLFVLGVVLKRRSLYRFKIALVLSFWRYVGYMAFPLQMVRTFPALARFLAARAATHSIHYIPLLGQPGGRLEYRVFDASFNLPLSFARSWSERKNTNKAGRAHST